MIFKKQKFRLPFILLLLVVVTLLVSIGAYSQQKSTKDEAQIQNDEKKLNQKIVKYRIKNGDTLSTVFGSLGISDNTNQILNASEEVYDFTKIKTGQLLKFIFVQEAFASMEYVATDHEVITVAKIDDGFEVTEDNIEYDIEQAVVGTTIN